jgi:hypothetical protein
VRSDSEAFLRSAIKVRKTFLRGIVMGRNRLVEVLQLLDSAKRPAAE